MLNFERRGGALTALLVLLLASCGPAQQTPTRSTRPTAAQTEASLDLRYANVVGVKFEQLEGQRYRFDVTLYHDDGGEAPAYADAWQVEDLDGNVLGVRELLHSHGTRPFTRSEVIEIPADVEVVIVRGHDQTHGFGGQIMRVNLHTGDITPVIGTDAGE